MTDQTLVNAVYVKQNTEALKNAKIPLSVGIEHLQGQILLTNVDSDANMEAPDDDDNDNDDNDDDNNDDDNNDDEASTEPEIQSIE